MTFVVWLAIAVLALAWAHLSLLHTRRILARVQQDHGVTQTRFATAPAAAPPRSSLAS